MVFSSIEFLFYFLPLSLLLYFISPRFTQNGFLLCFSLIFYAWGELQYIWVILASISWNYVLVLLLRGDRSTHDKFVVGIAVAGNLALLISFKYVHFLINDVLNFDIVLTIHLPLGISFFTFQAMSYVIDLYRGEAKIERNPLDVALYIALFPQLIAGPIVRFNLIADELHSRPTALDNFAAGMRLFVLGLAQKVLIANLVAVPADAIFAADPATLRVETVWFGVVCYTFQIFFDFAGYSLMAIGLGRVLGFTFPQNFNYPYISRSVTEFWHRWHITLSTWFRDYLYIPLGGNRHGTFATYRNLLIVFTLCGLWHGAAWTFLIWGLYHGFFLVIERMGFRNLLAHHLWRPFQHIYLLLVIMVGWTFFRCETLEGALSMLTRMLGVGGEGAFIGIDEYLNAEVLAVLFFAILFSTPLPARLFYALPINAASAFRANGSQLLQSAIVVCLILLVTAKLMASAYNPFIYFRF